MRLYATTFNNCHKTDAFFCLGASAHKHLYEAQSDGLMSGTFELVDGVNWTVYSCQISGSCHFNEVCCVVWVTQETF